ncbi:MAG: dUTP diphosphatase [Candidatus Auribacterota bacterium]|nr:dUTP diphosphatase [Candidatus Auribacterota bacterium]
MKIKIKKKSGFQDLELPRYMSAGAAGMDILAAIPDEVILEPDEIRFVPSGIYMELPPGYEAQLRPRSGLALRNGLSIVNSPGTVDSDYRGEIGVILINLGKEPVKITRGMRIAQMVIQEVVIGEWDLVEELEKSSRDSGGFGHTGH